MGEAEALRLDRSLRFSELRVESSESFQIPVSSAAPPLLQRARSPRQSSALHAVGGQLLATGAAFSGNSAMTRARAYVECVEFELLYGNGARFIGCPSISFNLHLVSVPAAVERHHDSQASGPYTGQPLDLFTQPIEQKLPAPILQPAPENESSSDAAGAIA